MAAVLWGSSSRIFSETQKRQEESTKNAVLKGAVQCYAVEGRYPESLSYLEQHYGVSYDKDKFIVSYEITGSNRMPQVTVTGRGCMDNRIRKEKHGLFGYKGQSV